MRFAFGPGSGVTIFGPATGCRVVVAMVFSFVKAGGTRTCRISGLAIRRVIPAKWPEQTIA
jgi:hypothetical protein